MRAILTAAQTVPIKVSSLPGDPWWRILLDIVAGLGAVIPLVFFLIERGDRKQAQEESRALRQAADRADANRFFLWAADMEHTRSRSLFKIRMINSGQAPVWSVRATVKVAYGGETQSLEYERNFVLPTAPGEIFDENISERPEVQAAIRRWVEDGARPPRPAVAVESLWFMDSHRRRWRRTEDDLVLEA